MEGWVGDGWASWSEREFQPKYPVWAAAGWVTVRRTTTCALKACSDGSGRHTGLGMWHRIKGFWVPLPALVCVSRQWPCSHSSAGLNTTPERGRKGKTWRYGRSGRKAKKERKTSAWVQKKRIRVKMPPKANHFYFHWTKTGNPNPREKRNSEDYADISNAQLHALLRALSRYQAEKTDKTNKAAIKLPPRRRWHHQERRERWGEREPERRVSPRAGGTASERKAVGSHISKLDALLYRKGWPFARLHFIKLGSGAGKESQDIV